MNKNMSIILSEHFRLTEFTTSLVAVTRRINNTPPLPAICNLQQLCLHVLEPLRAHLGHAVRINSGYRSAKLNAAVGGVKTSDHTRGCAADIFIPDAKTGREWFAWMMDNLEFDQLIWETASGCRGCWIHVGYRGTGHNRQQVIRMGKGHQLARRQKPRSPPHPNRRTTGSAHFRRPVVRFCYLRAILQNTIN